MRESGHFPDGGTMITPTPCTFLQSPASDVLDALYADDERQRGTSQGGTKPTQRAREGVTPFERFAAASHVYMAIDRPFGQLLYALIRSARPQTVVEFGTSFAISTIFLAAAVRDNGSGTVIATEFIPEKAVTATQNLTRAGLIDLIDLRVGDAIQTLQRPLPGPVDFLFLDGEKSMYVDVLKLLEPKMRRGCLIVSDNTDHRGTESYLTYVRDPSHGYVTTALHTLGGPKHDSGHEVTVRV